MLAVSDVTFAKTLSGKSRTLIAALERRSRDVHEGPPPHMEFPRLVIPTYNQREILCKPCETGVEILNDDFNSARWFLSCVRREETSSTFTYGKSQMKDLYNSQEMSMYLQPRQNVRAEIENRGSKSREIGTYISEHA